MIEVDITVMDLHRQGKPDVDQQLLGDGQKLRDVMMKSFREAVAETLAENDRLGITSYGAKNGMIVERKPPNR
jgi:hypothetical protein